MYHIDLSDAHLNLSELVEKALSGQEVFITKDNQPLVKLVSVSPPEKLSNRQPGTSQNLVQVRDDSWWESQELVASSQLNKVEEKLEDLNKVFDEFKKMVAELKNDASETHQAESGQAIAAYQAIADKYKNALRELAFRR